MARWIGVDLDGTLAYYKKGQGPTIGEPIPAMMNRVQGWLDNGQEVRICTARAAHGEAEISRVRDWLEQHGLGHLQVTCQKDFEMTELWDDKAIQVKPNTGEPLVDQQFQESLAETNDMSRGHTDPQTFELIASLGSEEEE
jgi:hypothetical protein